MFILVINFVILDNLDNILVLQKDSNNRDKAKVDVDRGKLNWPASQVSGNTRQGN